MKPAITPDLAPGLVADAALPLLIPYWPLPPTVRAACSLRAGGVSMAPFDSLNLGEHVGDAPAAVAENRARLSAALGARPVFLNQVHRWQVRELQPSTSDGASADACFTDQPGLACTVMVADCLPVLLCRADGSRVGAAHAGWRGLLGEGGFGVLEAVVQALASNDLVAWLGPCIGPTAFEVGAEVHALFVQQDADYATCFSALGAGKFLADLPALARRRLQHLGVERLYGNDGSAPWCTVTNPSRFFSHRRDRGRSGRFAASIWRV